MAMKNGNVEGEEEEEVIACAAQHLSMAHYGEICAIIDRIPVFAAEADIANCNTEAELNTERYQKLLDLYQEQPHLLDGVLEELMSKLIAHVRASRKERDGLLGSVGNTAFLFLSHLTKVRGYKVMLRYLPHEVVDFEPILSLLEHAVLSTSRTAFSADSQYMLLLWLNILSKNPFELSRFDGDSRVSVVERVIAVCRHYLNNRADRLQTAAALLLAQLVTRPDVKAAHLVPLVRAEVAKLSALPKDLRLHAHAGGPIGTCQLLAQVFKHGKREDLLPLAGETLTTVIDCPFDSADSLLRKLAVKLVQRVGLVLLKPRVAGWRYRRGNRSLADNLAGAGDSASTAQSNGHPGGVEDDEDYDIPEEELELVLGFVLKSLKDKDTVVRWSAAKGVGRVSARLPRESADDVISSLLESCFGPCESDSAWHGGSLALAELARRGYLLPARLPEAVPIVLKALMFSQMQGRHSVGAHVRDAACYICWSFARAYDPDEVAPYVQQLASALLTVTVFDREINVRRAASAAFQENVGRQGSFPHGIEILTVVDYFAVGQKSKCFHDLCVFIGRFPEYTRTLIDHLIEHKCNHWDPNIRLLAAEALRRLTALDPDYVGESILPVLLKRCEASNLFVKQGAMFALGHAVAALLESSTYAIPTTIIDQIARVPIVVAESITSGGKATGGEQLRVGLNVLLRCLAEARFPLDAAGVHLAGWNDALDRNLRDVNEDIRLGAGQAMTHLWTYYHSDSPIERISERLDVKLTFYKRQITDAMVEPERMGGVLALGALTEQLACSSFKRDDDVCVGKVVIDWLADAVASRTDVDEYWAEGRRDAVNAIAAVLGHVGVGRVDVQRVYACYMAALDDYTTNNRGDIGRVLREATMGPMARLLTDAHRAALIDEAAVTAAVAKLIQQSCEKIDSTRRAAATALSSLVHSTDLPLAHRPILHEVYQDLFELEQRGEAPAVDWHMGSCFDRLALLLDCDAYLYHVVLGFVVSAGGVTESTMRSASEALLRHLTVISESPKKMDKFLRTLAGVFADFIKCDRVTIPLMSVLEQILTAGLLQLYEADPDSSSSLSRLVDLTAQEGAAKRNPRKTKSALSVLCGMLQLSSNSKLWSKSAAIIVQSLCSSLPTVRRSTAEQFYEALLTYGCLDNHTEIVMTMLSDTKWDSTDMPQLREIQSEIASRIGVAI
uniref:Tubulin-specific chaperone D n=3 Tax=Plectus sambesii TaxID=2011161 RepID=A0A914WV96_9BILA